MNVRLAFTLIASLAAVTFGEAASAAHYGTSPPPSLPTSPTLSVSDHPPQCTSSNGTCVGTTGAVRAYPVATGDRVTLRWSSDATELDGVIQLGNLYLPIGTDSTASISPVTLEVQFPTPDGDATIGVEYAGTWHHVPLTAGEWRPISIYDPNERIVYVRFDLPPSRPPN